MTHTSPKLSLGLALLALLLVVGPAQARPPDATRAHEVSGPLGGPRTYELPPSASHLAVYWRGDSGARVEFAVSSDGRRYGPWRSVERDEVGEQRRDGRTYSRLILAEDAESVRVRSDRPLPRLTLLTLSDSATGEAPTASTHAAQPAIVSRTGWGADESLRFDASGNEVWPPAFYPTQKLIVHHTAGINDDPNPAATVRSIYYYHAVTQGWGDIGYNFLVDEAGNVYEGRYSREYAAGESPTGEDANGNGVTAAHASGYNSGTVGVALLGTLTNRDATAAARGALERLLAWKAERHGIDPEGSSLYTNPVNGAQKTFANIAGHRDVNATECPGSVFYGTLPDLRARVAALIAGPTDTTAPTITSVSPTDNATGVDPAGNLSVAFSEPMNKAATQDAFSLTPAGQPTATVSGSFSWNGNTMTFDPATDLAKGGGYTATVGTGATDVAGNGLSAEKSWNFTTKRTTPVTSFPSATTILSGRLRSGAHSRLAADDDSYYRVDSTSSGTRTSDWHGHFSSVSNALENLKIAYKGKNSRSCTQEIYVYSFDPPPGGLPGWVRLDTRPVGTSEILINLAPGGTLADYVSGTSGDGELQVRVRCTRSSPSFYASGDLLKIDYERP